MMRATLDEVIEGMEIIRKYSVHGGNDNREGVGIDEGGIILCGKYTGNKMSVADKARMDELGWFEDEDWGEWTKGLLNW